jgi:hypothetical protein
MALGVGILLENSAGMPERSERKLESRIILSRSVGIAKDSFFCSGRTKRGDRHHGRKIFTVAFLRHLHSNSSSELIDLVALRIHPSQAW